MRKLTAISLAISLLFSTLFFPEKVFAAPIPFTFLPESELAELMTIPQSINTFDPFDQMNPDAENTDFYVNAAQITDDDTIILMSEDLSSQGAVWSKEEYQLDLNKSFQIVMHLYFGDTNEWTDDGLAFVLQGSQSFTPYTYAGSSLGVLGENRYTGKNGMPNSFAIEFDLEENKSSGTRNYFDYYVGARHHLAYLWAGERQTYQDVDLEWLPWMQNWVRTVQHYGTYNVGNFTNGQWHRLEINWDSSEEVFDYTFDDWQTISVYNLKTKIGTNRVYWGFTGSTSNSAISPQIRIENIEGLVSSNVSMTAYYTELELEIFAGEFIYPEEELRFEITINYLDGIFEWENIVFEYLLAPEMQYKSESLYVQYSTGEIEKPPDNVWKTDKLYLPLLNMNENRNSITIVFLADVRMNIEKDTVISHWFQVVGLHESVPLMEYCHVVGGESNPTIVLHTSDEIMLTGADPFYIVEGIWRDLNPSQLSIQFFMNGEPVESLMPIPPFFNQFNFGDWMFTGNKQYLKYGQNVLTIKIQNNRGVGSSVDAYIYLQSKPMISWGDFSPPGQIKFGEVLELPFNWLDRDCAFLDIYIAINDVEPIVFDNFENPNPGESMSYTMKLSTKNFRVGINKIEIFIENSFANQSNSLAFTITTQKALVFSSPPGTLREEEIAQLSEKEKTYKLIAPPIQIMDTREEKEEWTLSVRLETPFKNEKNKMILDFFYCDENGKEIKITSEDSNILSYVTENAEEVVLDQNGKAGFYVRIQPGFDMGSYQASLHWTLV